jgi:hypothetical protein
MADAGDIDEGAADPDGSDLVCTDFEALPVAWPMQELSKMTTIAQVINRGDRKDAQSTSSQSSSWRPG